MMQRLQHYTDRLVDYTTPPQKPCQLKKAVFPYVVVNCGLLCGAWGITVCTRIAESPMPWAVAIPLSLVAIAVNSVLADIFVTLAHLHSSHIKKHQQVLDITFSPKEGCLQMAEIHQTLKIPPRSWSYRDQALYRQLIKETKQKLQLLQQEGPQWNKNDPQKKHKVFQQQFRNDLRHLADRVHRNMFKECVNHFFVIKHLRKLAQRVEDFAEMCFFLIGMSVCRWRIWK